MHTENAITIASPLARVFAVAAAVEGWPRFLPHYRWVRVLAGDGFERLVEMAAHRDGIPVRWTARQRLDPVRHRIFFTHVRGPSRGMEVCWFLEAQGAAVQVRIVHDLTLAWPLVGPWVAKYVIGAFFVSNIATKTLRGLKAYLEQLAP
ncbi:MAG: hypothetical protein KatS3mg131_1159 [Candidatus Tectimicrobiota bacterium]|nr:MAG: hypothetical protein KatS3mg131_1159 [Candidatus Tectomicrobia bacterium]